MRPPRAASRAIAHFLRPLGFADVASHHETEIPESCRGYDVIVPVRHHFDALVSWYYGHYHKHGGFGYGFGPKWLEALIAQSTLLEPDSLWGPWLRSATRIARFESLEADLRRALGLSLAGRMPIVGATRDRPADWRDAFSAEMLGHCVGRYGQEMRELGYEALTAPGLGRVRMRDHG